MAETFYIPGLSDHPEKMAIIGRLLLSYADLEVELSYAVEAALGSEVSIKSLFRTRGETQRVLVADGICRDLYRQVGLETEFAEVIGSMRHCLKIRNQYAHCNWYAKDEALAFIDLEDVAGSNQLAETSKLGVYQIDDNLLEKQESFFCYTNKCLEYLTNEYQTRKAKSPSHHFPKPSKVEQPLLHIPK